MPHPEAISGNRLEKLLLSEIMLPGLRKGAVLAVRAMFSKL
jgi:hypothetical protein